MSTKKIARPRRRSTPSILLLSRRVFGTDCLCEFIARWLPLISHPSSPRFLLCNPLIGPRLKQIERQSPAIEHLIVKFADVKLGPQLLLGTLPQFANLKLAQLVTE